MIRIPAASLLCICLSAHFASADSPTLSPADIRLAAHQQLHVDRFDLGSVAIVTSPGGNTSVNLQIGSTNLDADLFAAPVRDPQYQVLAQQHDGSLVPVEAPAAATYQGLLLSDPSSTLAVSLLPSGIMGALVSPDGSMVMLHPLALLIPGAPADQFIAYRPEDRLLPHRAGLACGTPDSSSLSAANKDHESPADGSCTKLAQIAYDADYEFYLAQGSSTDNVVNAIEASTNVMNSVFARDVRIVHTITAIVVRTDDNDPYSSSSAGTRLTQLGQEWTTNLAAIPRDAAHLISGYLWFDDSIIGLAWVGTVCDFNYEYGLSNMAWADVMTHEMGHNWGAPHCLDTDACNSMCGGCLNFGENTTDVILAFRDTRWCLDDIDYQVPTPPRARLDSAATLNTTPVTIDVLANDFDGNCQAITLNTFDAITPNGGTITRSVGTGPGGRDQLIYVPNASFAGLDTVNYSVMDTEGLTGPGVVRINVLALRDPENPPYVAPQARVSYYDLDAPAALPDFSTLTPYATVQVADVNFASTTNEFATSGRIDNVGARFVGYVNVPTDGLYWFSTESDDGSRLYIHDALVVNNDGLHGMTERTGAVGLKAGLHPIIIEFFESTGGAGLIVRYEGPGIAKQPIPAIAWSHRLVPNLRVDSLKQNQRATISCQDAPPGRTIYFLYSLRGSAPTFIPQLNIAVDLENPKLAGSDQASAFGVASIRVTPPPGSRNTVIWLQAALQNEKSNMILTQIN